MWAWRSGLLPFIFLPDKFIYNATEYEFSTNIPIVRNLVSYIRIFSYFVARLYVSPVGNFWNFVCGAGRRIFCFSDSTESSPA